MKVKAKQASSHDCIVCGIDNPLGLHADFYQMQDDSLIALAAFREEHQSYPSRTHGGMISALIDETIGRLLWIKHPEEYAVTMKLNIEFHKAVPYGVPLKCVAHLTKDNRMAFEGEAKIIDGNGNMLAKGTALYFKLDAAKITGIEDIRYDDINIMVPDDVKDIE